MPQEPRRHRLIAPRAPGAALLTVALAGCLAPAGPASEGAAVWLVDDGERVAHDDVAARAALQGGQAPLWSPGRPLRLFGLPGEVLAVQVVVSAGRDAGLSGVTVELSSLKRGTSQDDDGTGCADSVRDIQRFVTADLTLARRSGGAVPGESLGWAAGSQPPVSRFDASVRSVPDPLIPVAQAGRAPFADYPLTVAPGAQRVVWLDVTIPDTQGSGAYHGVLRVQGGGGPLATIAVDLEVGPVALPYAAVKGLVYYDPEEIIHRTGSGAAVRQYLQLMHQHHLGTVYRVNSGADVRRQQGELRGTLFTADAGYRGPGAGLGSEVVFLGTYGTLGDPGAAALRRVREALDALDDLDRLGRDPWLPPAPAREVYLYAVDEQCDSPRAADWRRLLQREARGDRRLGQLRIAQTCSRPPEQQPVDLALIAAADVDVARRALAAPAGRARPWLYNGFLPGTGSFLLDSDPLSLRYNGWLQAQLGVPRWYYWESTFWNDDNRGGRGPIDPLAQAETFHNQHGDHANGDGVLVYPGQQETPQEALTPWRSLGFAGVVPSLRLKQWRRGVQDAGYVLLARRLARENPDRQAGQAQERVIDEVVGGVLGGPRDGRSSAALLQARRRLFDLLVAAAGRREGDAAGESLLR